MNNAVNNQYNLNFTAKLDIRQMKGDKQRWKNIAKIFEEKTKNYPEDKFGISGGSGMETLAGVLSKDNLYGWLFCSLSKKASEKLFTLPDIAVAEKLKAIFQFLKYKEKTILDAEKFSAQEGFYSSKAPEKIDEKFWKLIFELIENKKKNYLDKDSLFKKDLKIW